MLLALYCHTVGPTRNFATLLLPFVQFEENTRRTQNERMCPCRCTGATF